VKRFKRRIIQFESRLNWRESSYAHQAALWENRRSNRFGGFLYLYIFNKTAQLSRLHQLSEDIILEILCAARRREQSNFSAEKICVYFQKNVRALFYSVFASYLF
jgi:hypothetical protein